ncbi:MAG: Scaffold-type E3 ligase [Peltula sp. TS41687]|nr:MAG: Scaffold-type E3 ligase [Peltula sp. TS41687]
MAPPKKKDKPLSNASKVDKRKKYFQQTGSSKAGSGPAGSQTLNKLFDKYRDAPADNPDGIGIDGSMKYMQDLKVDLEDIAVLIIGEALQSPSMGEFTREDFVAGWKGLNADTITKQQHAIISLRKKIPTDPELCRRVYRHTFQLARPASQKSIPLEIAIEYWRLLFSSAHGGVDWVSNSTLWLEWWLMFLQEKWKKSVNRDMWNMTYEFCKKTMEDESLGWWDENGAWPGVVDDFVLYVKQRREQDGMMDIG